MCDHDRHQNHGPHPYPSRLLLFPFPPVSSDQFSWRSRYLLLLLLRTRQNGHSSSLFTLPAGGNAVDAGDVRAMLAAAAEDATTHGGSASSSSFLRCPLVPIRTMLTTTTTTTTTTTVVRNYRYQDTLLARFANRIEFSASSFK